MVTLTEKTKPKLNSELFCVCVCVVQEPTELSLTLDPELNPILTPTLNPSLKPPTDL